MPTAVASRTRRRWPASATSRSPRHGRTSGSACTRGVTCRRRESTRPGASSTSTTRTGARGATSEKFDEMLDFAEALPRLRRVVKRDLAQCAAEPRAGARVRGAVARPRDVPHRVRGLRRAEPELRAGDAAEEARDSRRSAGQFDYPAKSNQRREHWVEDPHVVPSCGAEETPRWQRRAARLPRGRRWVDVTSTDVNEYVKQATGGEFSAKDFRTWNGTVLAAVALAEVAAAEGAEVEDGAQAQDQRRGQGRRLLPRQHPGRGARLVHRPAGVRPLRLGMDDRAAEALR